MLYYSLLLLVLKPIYQYSALWIAWIKRKDIEMDIKKIIKKLGFKRTYSNSLLLNLSIKDGKAVFTDLDYWLEFSVDQADGMYCAESFINDIWLKSDKDQNDFPEIEGNFKPFGVLYYSDFAKAANCAAKDTTRPALKCVYCGKEGEVVGTDGHKLYWTDNISDGLLINAGVLKLLTGNGDISVSDEMIKITQKDYNIYLNKAEGEYPNYLAVIPKQKNSIEVDRKRLVDTLKTIQPHVYKRTQHILFRNGNVMAYNGDKNLYTRIETEADFKMDIGFNAIFLLDMLKHNSSKTVKIGYTAAQGAVTIDDNTLITPIRIMEGTWENAPIEDFKVIKVKESKSKKVNAKDKKIRELEAENARLRAEIAELKTGVAV